MDRPVPTYILYGETPEVEPGFWLHVETIPSRSSLHHWEIRPHRHESFFQLLYIAGGSGDAVFGSATYRLDPPSIVTVPPAIEHGFRFSTDIEGYVFTILASQLRLPLRGAGRLGAFLSQPRVTALEPADPDSYYIAETFDRFAREARAGGVGRSDLMEAYLTVALTLTARQQADGDGAPETDADHERRVERFASLLNRYHRQRKDAAFYAGELGITPTHLNRVVRTATGIGAHDFIARKLISEAKRELVFSIGTIREIGYGLGFPDPAYFSRFFHRRTGMTPKAFRLAERARLAGRPPEQGAFDQ